MGCEKERGRQKMERVVWKGMRGNDKEWKWKERERERWIKEKRKSGLSRKKRNEEIQ